MSRINISEHFLQIPGKEVLMSSKFLFCCFLQIFLTL